jgi:putative YhdH/YhfP family quinone oxidoreductase
MVVEEFEPNKFRREIKTKSINELPKGDILIRVLYSSLNYKDALSARGHKGISKKYPHTPGIDAAGIVEESNVNNFQAGDEVLVTGYDLGMNTSGGFAEYISVPAEWVVPLPHNLKLRESMIYGTAGFTAALAIYEFECNKITPDKGKILVTGATGAVGILAVAMLSKLGYDVTASTGKPDKYDLLLKSGAKNIVSREDVNDKSAKLLLPGKWIGVIENVGGNTLSTVIRSMKPGGVVSCIGNVESDRLETNVYPFILRGVRLIGIDSAAKEMEIRLMLWNRIAGEWKLDNPEIFVKDITLDELSNEIDIMLEGKQSGKVLINMNL